MTKVTSNIPIDDISLSVQESMQVHGKKRSKIKIGIPKENIAKEYRVPLTPQAIKNLIAETGHHIIVEKGIGLKSNFSDLEYANAGADIIDNKKEVLSSNFIIKLQPPTASEVEMMQPKSTVISSLQYAKPDGSFIEGMRNKKITALGFEHIYDKYGDRPFLHSIGEIAGKCAVLLGARYLMSNDNQKGILLGGVTGIPKTNVLIFGAGAVGTSATLAALGLGCNVTILDSNIHKLHRLSHQLNGTVNTSIIQNDMVRKLLSTAHLIIGSLRQNKTATNQLITEEMSLLIKPKSVVIDLNIDRGGSFASSKPTTLEKPTYKYNDVIYCCLPNITSIVASTTSVAISNILLPLCLDILYMGGIENIIWSNNWLRKGVYTYNGHVTNYTTATKYGFKYVDISLLKWSNL